MLCLCGASALGQSTDVLTCHNDNARTGQALHEEILSPANVNTNHFGKLWVLPADGKVDAQPLYAAGVSIPGRGARNVLFVATDAQGNIYFLAANGTFDATLDANGLPSRGDFGNAFIKLSTASNQLAVADYFAGYTNAYENAHDLDLGSGGALVLPDMVDAQGNTRHLAVGAGKDQNIYLADRENMGKFSAANNDALYQELGNALPGGVWSMPAYFNGTLYYGAVGQPIRAFPFQNARLGAASSRTPGAFIYPGATPSVSANGAANGIVWAAENTDPAALHAYAATNLATEFYNSNQAPDGRDHFGTGNKFIVPTIASARVYVGTTAGVGVFGLLDRATLTPLQAWRDAHFGNPSNVGAGADGAAPAGDGLANLIKYALGLDPFTPVQPGELPAESIETELGESYATLTVNRAAQAPDITYVVEVSSDLRTWASSTGSTVTLEDTATRLVVRDATPLGTTPRFLRLVVSNP
jgi:hypothetical protein